MICPLPVACHANALIHHLQACDSDLFRLRSPTPRHLHKVLYIPKSLFYFNLHVLDPRIGFSFQLALSAVRARNSGPQAFARPVVLLRPPTSLSLSVYLQSQRSVKLSAIGSVHYHGVGTVSTSKKLSLVFTTDLHLLEPPS